MIVHTILGLPGENPDDILETISYLDANGYPGDQLQLLHVLKGTDLAGDYEARLFRTYDGKNTWIL